MHIQKPYKGIIVYVLIAVILSKIIFFSTRLLHAYVQCVYIVQAKYQIAPLKAVVGVDRPIKAPSMHIQCLIRKKLSKCSQLSFWQNYFV